MTAKTTFKGNLRTYRFCDNVCSHGRPQTPLLPRPPLRADTTWKILPKV